MHRILLFTTGSPFLGTKLLRFSMGRGSGAPKGLIRIGPYVGTSCQAGRRLLGQDWLLVSKSNCLDMFGERVGPPDPTVQAAGLRYARVFPSARRAGHSTSGRMCPSCMALLVFIYSVSSYNALIATYNSENVFLPFWGRLIET